MLKLEEGYHDNPNPIPEPISQSHFERYEAYLGHTAEPDNANALCQNRPALPLEANHLRSTSPVSIAATESSLNLYSDDAEVLRRISRLLQLPIVPRSQELVGPSGRPLGVEVAINAYQRGELSSEAMDSGLIPSALLTFEVPKEGNPQTCYNTDRLCSKAQIHRDDSIPLAMKAETFEDDDTSVDPANSVRKSEIPIVTRSEWSLNQCHLFESMAPTWEEVLSETHRLSRQLVGDGVLDSSAEQEADLKQGVPPSHYCCPLLTSSSVSKQILTPQSSLISQEPSPIQLTPTCPVLFNAPPITPDWVEVLRSQLPQAHHLRDTISCSPDQAKIHPVLRVPPRPSTQDKGDGHSRGDSTIRAFDPSNETLQRNDILNSPASPQMYHQVSGVPALSQQKTKAKLDGNPDIEATDIEALSSTTSSESRCDSQMSVARSSISTYSSSLSARRLPETYPIKEESTMHVSWPTETMSNIIQPKARPQSNPDELQTLLSLIPSSSSSDTSKYQKDPHDQRLSKASHSKDETYLRAQSLLFAQRLPAPNKPRPSPDVSFRRSSKRGSSLFSASKLTEFFGEEYTKVTKKNAPTGEKEDDHKVGQLNRKKSQRVSGVGEDVKKGLRRLIG